MDSQSQKKGDEVWLEEKISPTTTWIENLVKPLTVWMEQKINEPEQEADNQEGIQRSEGGSTLGSYKISSDDTVETEPLITAEQAAVLAKNHIAGDVLYIKLMPKTNQYRIKLISKLGEIHIVHVKAVSGDIVLPANKAGIEPVKQIRAGQGNQTSSVSESESDADDEGKR